MGSKGSGLIDISVRRNGEAVKDMTFHKVPVVVGRNPGCDLALPLMTDLDDCSFVVLQQAGYFYVVDASSKGFETDQGTVSRVKVAQGSRIQVGELTFEFSIPEVDTSANKLEIPSLEEIAQEALEEKRPSLSHVLGLDKVQVLPRKYPNGPMDLEVRVTWYDIDYAVRVFRRGEKIVIGHNCGSQGISIPTLDSPVTLGNFKGQQVSLSVPICYQCQVNSGQETVNLTEYPDKKKGSKKGASYIFRLKSESECTIELGNGIVIHLRYIEKIATFDSKYMTAVDIRFVETVIWSGIGHGILILMLVVSILMSPNEDIPKIKNVPKRYARLLKKPPRLLIKKKEKKKIAKKIIKPKKKVIVNQRKIKRINKYPFKIKSRKVTVRPANYKGRSRQSIKKIGALGALGALNMMAALGPQPFAININDNAGGFKSLNTSGVIGLLKSEGGKLRAAGMSEVKTKGMGYGSGTGYGVQGIKGRAGGRGIAGLVVGSPKIFKVRSKEGLTRKQVMEIVQKHLGKVQQCYEMSLLSKPDLAGRMEYEWMIRSNGTVGKVRVAKSNMGSADRLNGCVKKVFAKMKFPRAKNGQSTMPRIGFPFGQL